MKTDDLKRIILKMLRGGEFYGYEVHKKLISQDVKVEISYLYRILNEMLKERLLESRWEKSPLGPRKRIYQLGKKGRKELDSILLEAIDTVHYFYGEYLMSLPPEVNAFNMLSRLLSSNLKLKENVVFVVSEYAAPLGEVIHGLHNEIPEARIYVVKPESLALDLKLGELVFLDGYSDNVPLRSGYADLLVVVGLPRKGLFEKSLGEWRRVLRQSGKLTVVAQTVQVQTYKDPLTIGNFIEKREYETAENGEYFDREIIGTLLKKFFRRTEETQIVHLTIFSASERSNVE